MTAPQKPLNFNICHVSINEFEGIYEDLIVSLKGSLEDLGHNCSVSKNQATVGAINILIGSTIFASRYQQLNEKLKNVPYIVYQLEHLDDQHGLLSQWGEYYELIKNAVAVWDFSPGSSSFLVTKGLSNIFYLPPGFHRSLEKFVPAISQDIDVLFIGSPHPRRDKVLSALKSRGVNVRNIPKLFGARRNQLMARSKIILNIHAWDEINSLETVRISFLLANRNFVISESSDHNPYGDGLIYASYDEIVEKCIYFLGQPKLAREAIGFKGFMNVHHIDFAKNVENILTQMGDATLSKAANTNKLSSYGYARSSREDILQFIPLEAKNVLDIGCASGLLGLKIKQRQKCEILGIEINPKTALEASKHLDAVMCGGVESVLPSLPNQHYDCILLLDVIEHLSSPDVLLNQVHEKLSSDGSLILCIPNVAHWTVIQGLLEGSWNYSDDGILDRTHQKFFTFASILKLLIDAGFGIQSHSSTKLISPEPSEKIINTITNFSENGKNIFNQSMAYQFIFVCKKQ